MQKNVVITILTIALLVLVIVTIGYGCSFKMENFEDGAMETEDAEDTEEEVGQPTKGKPVKAPSALTPKEKEMFENIKNGTLTDEDIQKFIAEGKLTEKMVEKFLEHVDVPALPSVPVKTDAAPTKTAEKPAPVVEEDFDVEGFSGAMFAQY